MNHSQIWTILFIVPNIWIIAQNSTEKDPLKRVPRIFNVVKFPNELCLGSSLNGTCYTKEECSERGGTAQGNCANGYGVCCIISISCGSSSRDNNTYLRLGPISSFDSSNENCNYRICQTNNKICRIRLDFNTFSIQGPELGTT